jgi:predicted ATPase/Tfp pilus assembly protein PilF
MRLYALSGEKGAALQVYEDLSRILRREMGITPGLTTRKLYQAIWQSKTPEEAASSLEHLAGVPHRHVGRHNLPFIPTPFVGRKRELREVMERLRDPSCRVLTLVGAGGIGKTRLALRVGEELLDSYPDGVFFVPLESVDSAESIAQAVAEALGIGSYVQSKPKEQVLNYLAGKRLLLILDSFEHLIDSASMVADMISAAPQVQIMVTSRERLNLRCECVHEIKGLDFPQSAKERIEKYSAVQLFLQSARRVHPGFSMSEEERESVARICQITEGMPLGIEMAAAWVPMLDCREIAREIERNLDFLQAPMKDIPERHRSLEAVFRHSWNLLTEEERRAFKKMSLFRRSFRREAAEMVTGVSLPVLSALVGKSLLYRTSSGRYRVHQLLRQYGARMLDEDPKEKDIGIERYIDYYANFLSSREALLKGSSQKSAMDALDEEFENIRAAWEWAVDRGALEKVGKMLEPLWLFLEMRGQFVKGEEVFGMAESRIRQLELKTEAEKSVFGQTVARHGWFCFRISSVEKARSLLEESLEILRPLGARKEIAFSVGALGIVFYVIGEYGRAEQFQRESLEICREIGDRFGIARALNSLAFVFNALGRFEDARRLLRQAIAEFEALGNRWGVAFSLNNLGTTLYYLGEYEQAKEAFRQSLEIRRAIGDRWGIPRSLDGLGRVSCALGEFEEARKFLQETLKRFEESGDRRSTAYALFHLGDLALLKGENARARELYRESLRIRRQVRDRRGIVRSLIGLSKAATRLGRYGEASGHLSEAIEEARSMGSLSLVLEADLELAELLFRRVDPEGARSIAREVLGSPAKSKAVEEGAVALLRRIDGLSSESSG